MLRNYEHEKEEDIMDMACFEFKDDNESIYQHDGVKPSKSVVN